MTPKYNPKLMLKCAQKVRPKSIWRISPQSNVVCRISNFSLSTITFDPLTSASDREALMLVLQEKGWKFGSDYLFDSRGTISQTVVRYAKHEYYRGSISDESHAVLLVKCASEQWGIPLYVEDGK
jgi:hypothetical protein